MADTQVIRLTEAARFALGDVTVTPAARTLTVAARELVIEPRVMQVLVTLNRQRGEVVGREALIDACWDGRTVGEDAINRAILKLRRALDEIGGDVRIETVAKVGYRLCVGEVGSQPDQAPSGRAPSDRAPAYVRGRGRLWLLAGTGAVFALVIGALVGGSHKVAKDTRIIVVQPLHVAAGDAPALRLSQDFASDLSRTVLGHDGKLTFADARNGTPRTAAFAVTGSVVSSSKDLHAVVAVNGGDSPTILWSHDYTAPLADAAGFREQISTDVAGVLVCAIGTGGMPDELGFRTIALYLEACNLIAGDHRREAYLLRQVIARAPHFAAAWAALATSLAFASESASGTDANSMRRESRAASQRALSLDPHQGLAYFSRAMLLPGIRNWAAREQIVDAGLAAQPDFPPLYDARANDLAAIGREQDSIATSRRAVELDPLHPGKVASLADALADAGELDEANDVVRHMKEIWPNTGYTWNSRFRTAALFGDPREAEAILGEMRGRFFSAGEAAAWRTFLKAREAPTPDHVHRAIAALLDSRRQGATTDAELVSDFALLGHPEMALDVALHMPAQAETDFWFSEFLKPLWADPRFMVIANRQGLYPIWLATGLWPDFCSDHSLHYNCRNASLSGSFSTSTDAGPPKAS